MATKKDILREVIARTRVICPYSYIFQNNSLLESLIGLGEYINPNHAVLKNETTLIVDHAVSDYVSTESKLTDHITNVFDYAKRNYMENCNTTILHTVNKNDLNFNVTAHLEATGYMLLDRYTVALTTSVRNAPKLYVTVTEGVQQYVIVHGSNLGLKESGSKLAACIIDYRLRKYKDTYKKDYEHANELKELCRKIIEDNYVDEQLITVLCKNMLNKLTEEKNQQDILRAVHMLYHVDIEDLKDEIREATRSKNVALEKYSKSVIELDKLKHKLYLEDTQSQMTKEKEKNLIQTIINMQDTIELKAVGNAHMDIVVRTTLKLIDEEEFTIIMMSARSNWFNRAEEPIQELLKDIILTKKITLPMCTGVRITKPKNSEELGGVTRNNNHACRNMMPNAHIYEFNCWGDNERHIVDALSSENYEQVLGQIVATCSGLNVTDSCVMERVVELLHDREWYELIDNETNKTITVGQYTEGYYESIKANEQND